MGLDISPETGIPAGANQQVQYNNSGVFGASSALFYDGTSLQTPGGTSTAPGIRPSFSALSTGINFGNGAIGDFVRFCANSTNGVALISQLAMQFYNNALIGWQSGGNLSGGSNPDTALSRNAAGVVEINNGTAGTFADIKARNLTLSGNLAVAGTVPPPVTQNDEGTFTIPDTGELKQPDSLVMTGTESLTMLGASTLTLYDRLNTFPGKGSFNPGSFILRGGEYLFQYQKLNLNGNQQITLEGDAQIFMTDEVPGSNFTMIGN